MTDRLETERNVAEPALEPNEGKDPRSELPPDPDCMNDSRANWARHALVLFMLHTDVGYKNAACDLLCNLMHLADRDGTDFEQNLERARMHYADETRETEE